MATPSQYGPYSDRKGVTRSAKKLCEQLETDTFVVEVGPFKYRAFSADFPGDEPKSGPIVETFRWTRPKHRDCEHEKAEPIEWSFDGKVRAMRCTECGEENWLGDE